MSILMIAVYSINSRWLIAAISTVMMALIVSSYGFLRVTSYLFLAGIVVFFSVAVFMIIKTVLFREVVVNELLDPEKTNYYFSLVGIVSLVGICTSKIFFFHAAVNIFWYASVFLWSILTLSMFTILLFYRKSEDRKIERILNGSWLFATVGTQLPALLGIAAAEQATKHVVLIQSLSFGLWSVGACLYLKFMMLIILRLIFYKYESSAELSPYWMNIGAAALITLVGTAFCQHILVTGGAFTDFLPFLKGFSVFFWSIGFWWVPFLIIMAIRKRFYEQRTFMFTIGYWEIAFALSLYAAGTKQLIGMFEGNYLVILSLCFFIAGIVVYCFSCVFTVLHLIESSIWVPVNDLTINYIIPHRFTLQGKLFYVKEVVNEWLEQGIQGELKKMYRVITRNNQTCMLSSDTSTKKWYVGNANY